MKTIMGTNNFFKAEQERFDWMGRSGAKTYVRTNADVTITEVYPSKEDKRNRTKKKIAFTFRHHSRHAVSTTDYVMIAVVKNRIFFKTGNADNGFLIGSGNSKAENSKDNGYLRISQEEFVSRLESFVGSYELQYDKFYELFYIEKEETADETDA